MILECTYAILSFQDQKIIPSLVDKIDQVIKVPGTNQNIWKCLVTLSILSKCENLQPDILSKINSSAVLKIFDLFHSFFAGKDLINFDKNEILPATTLEQYLVLNMLLKNPRRFFESEICVRLLIAIPIIVNLTPDAIVCKLVYRFLAKILKKDKNLAPILIEKISKIILKNEFIFLDPLTKTYNVNFRGQKRNVNQEALLKLISLVFKINNTDKISKANLFFTILPTLTTRLLNSTSENPIKLILKSAKLQICDLVAVNPEKFAKFTIENTEFAAHFLEILQSLTSNKVFYQLYMQAIANASRNSTSNSLNYWKINLALSSYSPNIFSTYFNDFSNLNAIISDKNEDRNDLTIVI